MRFLGLFLALLLVANVCCAADASYDWSEGVRRDLVQRLRAASDEVELWESFSAAIDDPSSLEADLAPGLFTGKTRLAHRQLRASTGESRAPLQLGILVIEYASEAIAQRLEEALRTREPRATFKTGEVLIQFGVARRENQLLVAYSKNFRDPVIAALLASLSSE